MHTSQQIERWATECGMGRRPTNNHPHQAYVALESQLTRFAALVAKNERERMRDALLAEAGDSIRIAFAVAAIRNSDGG